MVTTDPNSPDLEFEDVAEGDALWRSNANGDSIGALPDSTRDAILLRRDIPVATYVTAATAAASRILSAFWQQYLPDQRCQAAALYEFCNPDEASTALSCACLKTNIGSSLHSQALAMRILVLEGTLEVRVGTSRRKCDPSSPESSCFFTRPMPFPDFFESSRHTIVLVLYWHAHSMTDADVPKAIRSPFASPGGRWNRQRAGVGGEETSIGEGQREEDEEASVETVSETAEHEVFSEGCDENEPQWYSWASRVCEVRDQCSDDDEFLRLLPRLQEPQIENLEKSLHFSPPEVTTPRIKDKILTLPSQYDVALILALRTTQREKFQEILRIQAMIVDLSQEGFPVKRMYDRIVRPECTPTEESLHQALLHRLQTRAASSFREEWPRFLKWVKAHVQARRFLVVTAGNYDVLTALRRQLERAQGDLPDWVREWVNLKVLASHYTGIKPRSVRGTLELLGIPTHGRGTLVSLEECRELLAGLCQRGVELRPTHSYFPPGPHYSVWYTPDGGTPYHTALGGADKALQAVTLERQGPVLKLKLQDVNEWTVEIREDMNKELEKTEILVRQACHPATPIIHAEKDWWLTDLTAIEPLRRRNIITPKCRCGVSTTGRSGSKSMTRCPTTLPASRTLAPSR